MTKGNVIDLIMYRKQRDAMQTKKAPPVSEELKAAIQNLIDRLKASEPVKRSGKR